MRVYSSVARGRSAHADFRAAREFGEGSCHHNRRDERRLASGNVNADAVNRIKIFADSRAVGIFSAPIFRECMLVVRLYAGNCLPYSLFIGSRDKRQCFFYFVGLYAQICCGYFYSVKFKGQFFERRIAGLAHF